MKSNQKNLFPSINGGYGGAATVVLAVSVLSFVVTRKARGDKGIYLRQQHKDKLLEHR